MKIEYPLLLSEAGIPEKGPLLAAAICRSEEE